MRVFIFTPTSTDFGHYTLTTTLTDPILCDDPYEVNDTVQTGFAVQTPQVLATTLCASSPDF